MTEAARSAARALVIAAGVIVTLVSAFALHADDWRIYVAFVLIGFLVHLPAVEVLPHVPLPVAELVTNIAFLYIAGPGILILRYVVPAVLAVVPGELRTRWKRRLFGAAAGADTTPAAFAADWSAWTLGLAARWGVVWALVPGADPTAHPGVILLAELAGYTVSGLLVLLPIYSFRPFLHESHRTPMRVVVEDIGLIIGLMVTPFVFLVIYGYRASGLPGAIVWALAALALHLVLRRLNERRLQLEEQNSRLEALQRALAHRERLSAIGKMSSVVSHQIQQQLGVIGLYADLIRNPPGDGDDAQRLARVRRDAGAIEDALASVNGVLRDLLVFSKDQRLNLYEHDVGTIVDEAITSCRPAADARAIVLRSTVPRPLPVTLDKLKIHQTLANLLRNAIEASPPGGAVEVRAVADHDGLELRVVDQGAGVPASEREAVFAPFFTTKEQGTGLGLAIAREFARAHGGDLWVAPDHADGAVFVLRLPAHGAGSSRRAGRAV